MEVCEIYTGNGDFFYTNSLLREDAPIVTRRANGEDDLRPPPRLRKVRLLSVKETSVRRHSNDRNEFTLNNLSHFSL